LYHPWVEKEGRVHGKNERLDAGPEKDDDYIDQGWVVKKRGAIATGQQAMFLSHRER